MQTTTGLTYFLLLKIALFNTVLTYKVASLSFGHLFLLVVSGTFSTCVHRLTFCSLLSRCRCLPHTCIGCEYGDKNPKYCKEGRKSDCYDSTFANTCCDTCAKQKSSDKQCEFGDKAAWCSKDIKAPAWQCYSQHDSCCETCKRFQTSIKGRRYTFPALLTVVTVKNMNIYCISVLSVCNTAVGPTLQFGRLIIAESNRFVCKISQN